MCKPRHACKYVTPRARALFEKLRVDKLIKLPTSRTMRNSLEYSHQTATETFDLVDAQKSYFLGNCFEIIFPFLSLRSKVYSSGFPTEILSILLISLWEPHSPRCNRPHHIGWKRYTNIEMQFYFMRPNETKDAILSHFHPLLKLKTHYPLENFELFSPPTFGHLHKLTSYEAW
jgi:hypothetical protein